MPNEPVQCPNCGSRDVRQLAAESYVCEHCRTGFRWVDPTMRAVVHDSRICKCGTYAMSQCVRCHEPLCNVHQKKWGSGGQLFSTGVGLKLGYGESWSGAQLATALYSETQPEIARGVTKKHCIPEFPEAVLCSKCESECREALERAVPDPERLHQRCLEDAIRAQNAPRKKAAEEFFDQYKVWPEWDPEQRTPVGDGTEWEEEEAPPPTRKTTRGSPLLERLWGWLRGGGK